VAESLELLGYRGGANPSRPHHFSFFLIFLINASASPLGGACGGATIHLFGFGQANHHAKPAAQKKSSNP
jgi:hypothetical protein